jgi:hypothetical protein
MSLVSQALERTVELVLADGVQQVTRFGSSERVSSPLLDETSR